MTEAEDEGAVLSLSEVVEVPLGQFSDCLMTADFSPLEPGSLTLRFYAPGIGPVLAVNLDSGAELELLQFTVPEP